VEGTKTIIAAAQETGVRKLVFTSSAGVVFNGADIIDIDERVPFPDVPLDAYNDSKAKAEVAVLESNGKGGLLTVALRPAGIFGSVKEKIINLRQSSIIIQPWRPASHVWLLPSLRPRPDPLPNR
jgi:nucleoside-diphosphate-sugar epimerase